MINIFYDKKCNKKIILLSFKNLNQINQQFN